MGLPIFLDSTLVLDSVLDLYDCHRDTNCPLHEFFFLIYETDTLLTLLLFKPGL